MTVHRSGSGHGRGRRTERRGVGAGAEHRIGEREPLELRRERVELRLDRGVQRAVERELAPISARRGRSGRGTAGACW